jgi:hypothetical protein
MKTKEEKEEIINATFLDAQGKTINVKDVINKEDCWKIKDKWVITYRAAKQIAKTAGISKNFKVEESEHVVPDYRNDLSYIVRVTINCKACASKSNPDECIHGERTLTATGEANRKNCASRGHDYLRKMAEKRGFMIAVLEHLDLYSAIFCEDESDDFVQKKEVNLMPGMRDFELLVPEINAILECKTEQEIKKVGKKIKAGVKINKYNPKQLEYLRNLYNMHHAKKLLSF